ncbi:MAG: beta-ketoacyl synthase [Phycisphaerales bacterium]
MNAPGVSNVGRQRRVVITGMGWVTPLGFDVDSVWTKLLSGASAIGPVTHFPAETFRTNFAAEVKGFDLANFFAEPEPFRHAQRNSAYALAAAAMAWKQAGLGDAGKVGQINAGFTKEAGFDERRVGIYLGAGEGILNFDGYAKANLEAWDSDSRSVDFKRWAEEAYKRFDAHGETEQEPNMPVTHLAEAFGACGPAFNCMTACAASTQSVGEAFEILSRGDADIMLAGGAHSMIHPLGMTGFIRLTAMSTRRDEPSSASRPFDQTRDGFVMGEGAGILVLEDLEHALARGATPVAEVCGYGSSADAYRITDIQPEGKGAIAAMGEALEQAGIDPGATDESGRPLVHYISAHGTGTKENDSIETRAVKGLFGDNAGRIPFSSVKSMMGHLIQAAGAVELITCVQAIRTGFVPPTMNLRTPDPVCDLDYVPNQARDLADAGGVEVAMSNSFGFGGQNDTLVVRRYRG